jgi:hypothetical protein
MYFYYAQPNNKIQDDFKWKHFSWLHSVAILRAARYVLVPLEYVIHQLLCQLLRL